MKLPKTFCKEIDKSPFEVVKDAVTKGDYSRKKEVIDEEKVAKVIAATATAAAAIGKASVDTAHQITKEGMKAQFEKGKETISKIEGINSDSDDCDD